MASVLDNYEKMCEAWVDNNKEIHEASLFNNYKKKCTVFYKTQKIETLAFVICIKYIVRPESFLIKIDSQAWEFPNYSLVCTSNNYINNAATNYIWYLTNMFSIYIY